MRRDLWQKGVALGITLLLVLLIITVFTPSFSAVKLSPGQPDQTSVTKNTKIVFSSVNLTIRSREAIPVDYLMFTINQSSNDIMVAYVMFSLNGTKIIDYPLGAFTVKNLTNTSNLPYQSEGNFYGYDEEAGRNVTGFNYGYGNSTVDLSILYDINYTTHVSGTFYARLFVNSTNHTYASGPSITFTVKEPDGGGGGGGDGGDGGGAFNQPPIADAGGPYTGYVMKLITFSGTKSTDDAGVTHYRWDWTNDGVYDTNWSAVAIITHSYDSEGVYTLRLEVKDAENLTSSNTTTVIVTVTTDQFQAPVAEAAGPYQGLTYQNIYFDGSHSYGINANIIYYLWAFGDGTYGYNVTAAHAYETEGTFTVVLTVTDSNNLIAIDTTTAIIELDANRNNISDIMDQAIGANVTQADLHSVSIGSSAYYLVDTDHDGRYDIFYDPTTYTKTVLGQQQGKLLIDVNGDGIWDVVYDPIHGTVSPYKKESPSGGFPWLYVGLTVVFLAIIVLVVVFYLRKNFYI
jgi:hypothetical protein